MFFNNEVVFLDLDPGICETKKLLQTLSANSIMNQLCRFTFKATYFVLVKCEIMIFLGCLFDLKINKGRNSFVDSFIRLKNFHITAIIHLVKKS